MKKGLLRALSAVVAISMLFCMSMVAFGDVTTSTSVTSYDVTNKKVTVTTSVTGAQPSDQVAFLVENSTGILWIDQKPADNSGAASSSFTASVDDAVGALAKVGTTSTAATAITQDEAIALPNYTVTWSEEEASDAPVDFVTKSEVTAVVGDASINTGAESVSTEDTVTFYVMCAPGEKLVSINGNEATLVGGAISFKVGETKVTDYDFAFGPAEATGDGSVTITKGEEEPYNASTKKASVVATATNATEFGIVVARKGYNFSKINFSALTTGEEEGAEAIKLAALGANEAGQFVIVIDDAGETFFVDGAEYEARVYAVKDGAPVYGDTFALN